MNIFKRLYRSIFPTTKQDVDPLQMWMDAVPAEPEQLDHQDWMDLMDPSEVTIFDLSPKETGVAAIDTAFLMNGWWFKDNHWHSPCLRYTVSRKNMMQNLGTLISTFLKVPGPVSYMPGPDDEDIVDIRKKMNSEIYSAIEYMKASQIDLPVSVGLEISGKDRQMYIGVNLEITAGLEAGDDVILLGPNDDLRAIARIKAINPTDNQLIRLSLHVLGFTSNITLGTQVQVLWIHEPNGRL